MKMPEFSTELVLLIGLGVGRRLRAVHRLAPPPGPAGGPRRRVVGRARDRHLGSCRAVRRHDRVHRAPRDVRAGDQLPLRARGRREHRRAVHDGRGAHVPAGDARLRRARRSSRAVSVERSRRTGTARRAEGRLLGPLVEDGRAEPGRVRRAWRCSSSVSLAAPFFRLRLGSSDQGNDPKGTTTRTAYDLLAKGFGPGFNGPLQVVAETTRPGGGGDDAAARDDRSGPTRGRRR